MRLGILENPRLAADYYGLATDRLDMWAFVISGLAFDARIMLCDGSPLVPDPLILLRI
jgi:hypothetical protein